MDIERFGVVIIMRGIPGSGKTWFVDNHLVKGEGQRPRVFSTDNFWTLGGQGYHEAFDPKRLGEAHDWNLRNFIEALIASRENALAMVADGATIEDVAGKCERNVLVVDNTNLSVSEVAPYYHAAQAFGFWVEIQTIMASFDICLRRQMHGLRTVDLYRMYRRGEDAIREMPPYWRHYITLND